MKKSPKEIVDMALAFSDNLIEKMSQNPENAQLIADYQKLKNDIENELKDDSSIEKFSAKKLAAFGILRKFSKSCDTKKFGEMCDKMKDEGIDPEIVDAVKSNVDGNPYNEYMSMLSELAENSEAKEIADSVEVTEDNVVDKLKEFSVEEPQDAVNVGIKFVEQMLDKMKNAEDKDEDAIKNTEAALDAMKKYMDKPETKEFSAFSDKLRSIWDKIKLPEYYEKLPKSTLEFMKSNAESRINVLKDELNDLKKLKGEKGIAESIQFVEDEIREYEYKLYWINDILDDPKVKEFAASKKYNALNDNVLLNLIHSIKTNIAINEQAISELGVDEKDIKDDIEADTKKYKDQLDEMMKEAKDRKIDSQVQKVTIEFSSEDVVSTPDVIPNEQEEEISEVKPEIVVDYDPESEEISIN